MKTKLILSFIIFVLCGIAYALFEKTRELKRQNEIHVSNENNLIAENMRRTALILTYKQAQAITSLKIDSLTNALNIRPKTIYKTIEKTVIQSDTIIKEVVVTITGRDSWKLTDAGDCFTWSANAYLINDSLRIARTGFDYVNKSTDIYYKERPKKFWFIRYGKKKVFVKTSSDCGSTYTREIDIF